MQLDVTGFLGKKSKAFVEELWTLLVDAQSQPQGIPSIFIQHKREELLSRQQQEQMLQQQQLLQQPPPPPQQEQGSLNQIANSDPVPGQIRTKSRFSSSADADAEPNNTIQSENHDTGKLDNRGNDGVKSSPER